MVGHDTVNGVSIRFTHGPKDAAKFGQKYLTSFGWDSSKGLGVKGDGRTSHIKVSHKLDMLGIGGDQQKGTNGVAWKQNQDFENVLKRLNESIAVGDCNTESPEDPRKAKKRKRSTDKERERDHDESSDEDRPAKTVVSRVKAYVKYSPSCSLHLHSHQFFKCIVTERELSRPKTWPQSHPLRSPRFSE